TGQLSVVIRPRPQTQAGFPFRDRSLVRRKALKLRASPNLPRFTILPLDGSISRRILAGVAETLNLSPAGIPATRRELLGRTMRLDLSSLWLLSYHNYWNPRDSDH